MIINKLPTFLLQYNTGLLQESHNLAGEYYGGIMRKDKKKLYISHPIKVCKILHRYTKTDEIELATAILHDVFEEIPKFIKNRELEIQRRKKTIEELNQEVYFGVNTLSKYYPKYPKNLDKKSIEIKYKKEILGSIEKLRKIKLADNSHNIFDFLTNLYLTNSMKENKIIDGLTFSLDLLKKENTLTKYFLTLLFDYLEDPIYESDFKDGITIPNFNKTKKEKLEDKLRIYNFKINIENNGLILPQR